MNLTATIEKCDNGYIVETKDALGRKQCFAHLEQAFDTLLMFYEGRSRRFSGDSYGEVAIIRGPQRAAGEQPDPAPVPL